MGNNSGIGIGFFSVLFTVLAYFVYGNSISAMSILGAAWILVPGGLLIITGMSILGAAWIMK